jgi:hypothetical protein
MVIDFPISFYIASSVEIMSLSNLKSNDPLVRASTHLFKYMIAEGMPLNCIFVAAIALFKDIFNLRNYIVFRHMREMIVNGRSANKAAMAFLR